MNTRISSEPQKYRTLPTLLEIEEVHFANCKRPHKCQTLRHLREDIAELRSAPDCESRRGIAAALPGSREIPRMNSRCLTEVMLSRFFPTSTRGPTFPGFLGIGQ